MPHLLELTKAERLRVAQAFRPNKRVDFSIECVVEGQLGRVFVDDLVRPTAYCLRVGPFGYFAGDGRSPGGYQLMQSFPAYQLLMPSPVVWLETAREIFGDDLIAFPRYSFASTQLSADHLGRLVERSPFCERLVPISVDLAAKAIAEQADYLDLSDFDSAADFVERGLGYSILDKGTMIGVAYSSLVCSQGIEVSVFVKERYRQQGVATALCSRLLLEALRCGLRPHWDAANPESIRLAKKLGYLYEGSYDAYYHTKQGS